ncbi:MAG: NUDIX domain-containing protein [Candidatus Berkiella sp.]
MAHWNWSPAWQQQDVEIKQKNLVHDGFFKMKELHLRHRCFSGEWSPWLVREQIMRQDAAAILLVDLEQEALILVEQLRVGLIEERAHSPWMLEIVAGLLEDGEDPKETIRREALEEAHCIVGPLHHIAEFYNSPGGFAEKTTLFCANVLQRNVQEKGGVQEEHEDIRIHTLPIQEVLLAFAKGELLSSASTVIALQWLKDKVSNSQLATMLKAT